MTCKDCIHYDVCDEYAAYEMREFMDGNNCDWCEHFKDKSLMLELPCKIGDTVFLPWIYDNNYGIAVLTVTEINLNEESSYIETDLTSDSDEFMSIHNNGIFYFDEFGEIVFLIKEEAEKALGEKKK